MNIFDKANQVIRDIESSFVNFVSAIAPWLAPLAPAYMAYNHMIDILLFPKFIAVAIACVIEFLGLSAVSTIMRFWQHNRENRAQKNQVSIKVPVFTFLFYLVIIMTVNVLLELNIPKLQSSIEIIARAMLTLLSVPAALILSSRTMQHDILSKIKEQKTGHKTHKRPDAKRPNVDNLPVNLPDAKRPNVDKRQVYHVTRKSQLTAEMRAHLHNGHSPSELKSMFPGVSGRTLRRWKEEI